MVTSSCTVYNHCCNTNIVAVQNWECVPIFITSYKTKINTQLKQKCFTVIKNYMQYCHNYFPLKFTLEEPTEVKKIA